MATVKLFGFAPSTYVRTVRLVCVEKAIEHQLMPVDFRADSHRELHPYLKMPAMQHGRVALFETLAIACYLNEAFAGPDLAGRSVGERGQMLQWVGVANSYLYDGIVGRLAKSEDVGAEPIAQAVELLRPLDRALATHTHLAGDELTLADLFVLPMLLFADQAIGDSSWRSPLERLSAWLDCLSERPSVAATAA